MQIEIFDVEHGSCALLTLDGGQRIAIDCGHNSTTRWTLHDHLRALGTNWLDELWLTNLDQDHLSGLAPLVAQVAIGNILMNPSITPLWLREQKLLGGAVSDDIDALCRLMAAGRVNLPFGPLPANVGVHYAWNLLGPSFDDTNNLSLVATVRANGINVLFPGDVEERGMRSLLHLHGFAQAVRDVHVVVLPHHGRDNGCCEELFDAMQPGYPLVCIASDGPILHDTQMTHGWYGNRAAGIVLAGANRKVLTTRSDGHIYMDINEYGRGTLTTSTQIARERVQALADTPRNRLLEAFGSDPSLSSLARATEQQQSVGW
jgi:beta-lactamase superfamily II metal-dependent hydrolase